MSGTKPWLVLDSLEDVARQLIEQGGSCSVMVDFRNYDSSSPLVIACKKVLARDRVCVVRPSRNSSVRFLETLDHALT